MGGAARWRGRAAEQSLTLEVDQFGVPLDLPAFGVRLAMDERGRRPDFYRSGGPRPGPGVDAGRPHLVGPPLPAARQAALTSRCSFGRLRLLFLPVGHCPDSHY